jgi:hypothetical protein
MIDSPSLVISISALLGRQDVLDSGATNAAAELVTVEAMAVADRVQGRGQRDQSREGTRQRTWSLLRRLDTPEMCSRLANGRCG